MDTKADNMTSLNIEKLKEEGKKFMESMKEFDDLNAWWSNLKFDQKKKVYSCHSKKFKTE